MTEQTVRDHRGHFLPGVSGNPRGRPRGSKNRYPRRRADQGRAAKWTRHDFAVFYRRTFHETDGDAGQKHAAAFSDCMAGSYFILLFSAPGCALNATSLSKCR